MRKDSSDANLQKVHFDLHGHKTGTAWGEGWHQASESLWAQPLGPGLYELRNNPFHAYGVSYGDVVRAELSADGRLMVKEVVKPSGQVCFRYYLEDNIDPVANNDYLQLLREIEDLGGALERYKALFSICAPMESAQERIRTLLERGKSLGVWEWEVGNDPSRPNT